MMDGRSQRLPPWVRRTIQEQGRSRDVKKLLRGLRLNTVCDEARCPNQGECYGCGTATFLLMGPSCTRRCRFCAIPVVEPHPPAPLDPEEPSWVAEAAARLGLTYVVVTSVTRDDRADGGAHHFVATVQALRSRLPRVSVEVLTPDFRGSEAAIEAVAQSGALVLNHNIETVEALSAEVRPQASYRTSLRVLERYRALSRSSFVKSGLMVGLGEDIHQVRRACRDLVGAGCQVLTIGQYLRPRRANIPVSRYWRPEEFDELAAVAREEGMERVVAGPLVRSSYRAHEIEAWAHGQISDKQEMEG